MCLYALSIWLCRLAASTGMVLHRLWKRPTPETNISKFGDNDCNIQHIGRQFNERQSVLVFWMRWAVPSLGISENKFAGRNHTFSARCKKWLPPPLPTRLLMICKLAYYIQVAYLSKWKQHKFPPWKVIQPCLDYEFLDTRISLLLKTLYVRLVQLEFSEWRD